MAQLRAAATSGYYINKPMQTAFISGTSTVPPIYAVLILSVKHWQANY